MPTAAGLNDESRDTWKGYNVLKASHTLVFAFALAGPAAAADLPSAEVYTIDPKAAAVDPWQGFYVGGGISASFAKGAKGAFGADAFAGYDHRFDSGLVLGAEFSTGYVPWVTSNSMYKGFDFASAGVKVGYDMGRVTPYVTTGVALGKATTFASPPDASGSVNALFSGPGAAEAFGYVGAGVQYQVNDRVTIGIEGRVGNGPTALTH